MDKYVKKIEQFRRDRGWSVYKLAQESGLSAPTIHQWLETETRPTLSALEDVCKAFKITLADFFTENELIEVNPRIKALYDKWCSLTEDEKKSVELIVGNYVFRKQA